MSIPRNLSKLAENTNSSGVLGVASGGTGGGTAADAKTALGLHQVATTGSYADLTNKPTTAQITENTNLYYTDARVRAAISASGSLSYNSSTGTISYTTPTTTGVVEGTNLYYTDTRARAAFSAGTGISYNSSTGVISTTITQYTDALARSAVSATGSLSYNSTTGVFSYTTPNTGGISEGSNLYFTDARARAAVSASGSLSYNSTTGVFSYTTPSTSGIAEGTNLYYTDARAISANSSAIATAKSEAISTAATDATNKANAAQAAAISAVTNGAGAAFDTLKEIQDAMATDVELANAIAAITIGNATQTISAGTGLSGGGSFTANQTSNSTVTLGLGAVGTAGTYTKVTTDAYGRVTSGTTLSAGDIPSLSGSYLPLSGGTLTGGLVISSGGTGQLQLVSPSGTQSLWIRAGYTANGTGTPLSSPYNVQFQSSGSSGGTFTFATGNDVTLSIAGNAVNSSVALQQSGNQVLHAGNYNSYAPTLTGTGASGIWNISVTGNAAGLSDNSNWMLYRGSVAAASIDTATGNGFYTQNNVGDSQGVLVFNSSGSLGPLQMTFTYGGLFQFRNKTDSSSWTGWKTVLTSLNYNSYSPTLTGGNASGTWGINVTGSAGSVPWTGVTGTPTTLAGYGITDAASSSHTHSYLPLSGGTLSTTQDQIVTFNKSSGTGWNYIGFNHAGTRRFYFGLNAAFEPELGADNSATFRVNSNMTVGGYQVLHSNNYNSYSPTLTGGNASGTWNISITGSAGSVASTAATNLYSPNGATVVAADSAMPSVGNSLIHTLAGGPSNNDGHILGMTWANTTSVYGAQIWLDTDPTNRMAIRSRSGVGVWNSWADVITTWTDDQVKSGYFQSNSSLRAPIFYDSNDTAYYIDPNNNSKLVNLGLGVNPDVRLSVSGDTHISGVQYMGGTAGSYNSWGSRDYTTSGIRYFNASSYEFNNYGYGSNWTFTLSSGNAQASSSLRAPIFYDSDNTAGYLNPGATSGTIMGTGASSDTLGYNPSYGIYIGGINGRYLYSGNSSYTGPVFWNGSAAHTVLHTGNISSYALSSAGGSMSGPLSITGNGSYVGDWGYSTLILQDSSGYPGLNFRNGNSNWLFRMNGGGSTMTWAYSSNASGQGTGNYGSYLTLQTDLLTHPSSMRTPVFYDSDNTSYYLDPASLTSLRTVGSWRSDSSSWDGEFAGKIQYHAGAWYLQYTNEFNFRNSGGSNVFYGDGSGNTWATASSRAPIFYDTNNTSYYVDPTSSSISAVFAGPIVAAGGLQTATSGFTSPYNIFTLSNSYNGGTYYGIKYVEGNPDVIQIIGGNNVGLSIGMDVGDTTASSSLRAPIFYDSNNTGYYIDPASTSYVNVLSSAGGMQAPFLGVTNTGSSNGYGISLYNGYTGGEPTYGLMFQGVGTFGSHGGVTNDWATYFTMNGTSNRGWIFRNVSDGNVASVSNNGRLSINSHFEQGNNYAHPNIEWAASGTSYGEVIFYLPGTTSNYGMVHMVFDMYEYVSGKTATVTIGGHNWSTYWYETACDVVGYTDKQVRIGTKDGRFVVVFGTTGSVWSYGTIRLRKIHNGSFYNNTMDMLGNWEVVQTTTESFTNITGDLRSLRTPGEVVAYGSVRSPAFYDSNDTSYFIDPHSGSLVYNLRAANQFYIGNGSQMTMNYDQIWRADGGQLHLQYSSGGNIQMCQGGGYAYSMTSLRAPIFYDSNDTSYYVDPASASVFNDVRLNNGNLQIRSNNVARNTKWRQLEGSSDVGISFYNAADTWCMQLYANNGGEYGFLNGNWAGWDLRKVPNGNLTLNGQGTYYYGSDTTYMYRVYGTADIRSPVYYDNDNTGYYVDPNSVSYLYGLTLAGGSYFRPQNWIQQDSAAGIYWPNHYGAHFEPNVSSTYTQFKLRGYKNSYGGIWDEHSAVNGMMYDGGGNGGVYRESNGRWYWYYLLANDCMGIGTSTTSSTWSIYANKGAYFGNRTDAPIYYDANNTGYYCDPDSTSTFYRLNINNNVYFTNYGRGMVGEYASTRYQAVFAMGDAYKLPDDGTSTGNLYGIAWSHPNAGGVAGNLDSHGLLVLINGGYGSSMSYSIRASGNVTAYSDERLKTNWRSMPDNYVARLAEVKVGIYDRTDGEKITQVGVGAQSLQTLLPEAITTATDEMQTLSVNYGGAALASAVELAKHIVKQDERIARLEALIETLLKDKA